MFRVYRQDRHFVLDSQSCDQFAGHHQRLFVCQRDRLTGFDRCDRRFQPRISHHCRQHHIDRFRLDDLGNGIRTRPYLDREIFQRLLQFGIFLLVGDYHHFRHIFTCLINQQIHLIIGSKSIYFKKVRMFADYFQSLCSDRTCRT